jgi:outer membrane protein OmpA-like peptidoglycan-associated protein
VTTFSRFISFFYFGKAPLPPVSIVPPFVPQRYTILAYKAEVLLRKIYPYNVFKVIISKNNVTIRFPIDISFDEGDFKLKPRFKEALIKLIPLFKEIKGPYRLVVVGYTYQHEEPKYRWLHCKEKITSDCDQWLLSAKRATEVVRFLIAHGMDRKKLVAEAKDSLNLLYRGKNKELLRKNARVELQIRFYTDEYVKGVPPLKPLKNIVPIPELQQFFNSTESSLKKESNPK